MSEVLAAAIPAPPVRYRMEFWEVPDWVSDASLTATPEELDELLSTCGSLICSRGARNLVTTAGKNDIGEKYFKGSAYTAAWYVGLKGTGSAAAGDTMASHAGWSELTIYSNATRPALTLATFASGSASNSSSLASFTINASGTVHGGFVCNSSIKGSSGASEVLYSVADFSGGSQAVSSGQIQRVQITTTFT